MDGWMEAVKILKEQLENDEWNGDPPIALGDNMATSLSRDSDDIAIAMPGGWWVMSHDEVRRLVSRIPNAGAVHRRGSEYAPPPCSPFPIRWAWGWPSADTFDCPAIGEWVRKWMDGRAVSVDPFARNRRWATHTNDLNPETAAEHHMDAEDFCRMLAEKGVAADIVLFDPPYSPTQMKAVYDGIGIKHEDGGSNARLYARVRRAFEPMVKVGGVVLTFGWNTHGMMTSKGYAREELLVVCHGQAHNDTLCLAERKVQGGLFDTANIGLCVKTHSKECQANALRRYNAK